jgi:hypothetical protein
MDHLAFHEANDFYHLIADPGEARNLFDREAECAEVLRVRLYEWLATVDGFDVDESKRQIPPDGIEQLRSVGS